MTGMVQSAGRVFARPQSSLCFCKRQRGNVMPSPPAPDLPVPALRVIATGLRFPEGPVAMKDGSIALVEIERQTVSRVHPDGRTEVIAYTGGGPNGLAVGPDGAFYVCNNGGFQWGSEMKMLRPVGPARDYA